MLRQVLWTTTGSRPFRRAIRQGSNRVAPGREWTPPHQQTLPHGLDACQHSTAGHS